MTIATTKSKLAQKFGISLKVLMNRINSNNELYKKLTCAMSAKQRRAHTL